MTEPNAGELRCHWSGRLMEVCRRTALKPHVCVPRTPATLWCDRAGMSPQQLADIRACVDSFLYDVDSDADEYLAGAGERLGAILKALPEADEPNSLYLRAEDRT